MLVADFHFPISVAVDSHKWWGVAHLPSSAASQEAADMQICWCVCVCEGAEFVPQTFVFLWDPLHSSALWPKHFQQPMGCGV